MSAPARTMRGSCGAVIRFLASHQTTRHNSPNDSMPFEIRPINMAATSWNERKTRDDRQNDEEKDRNSAAPPSLTTAAPVEAGTTKTKSVGPPPSWQQLFRTGFPVRRVLPPLRLKVLEDYEQHQHDASFTTSTVGESASSSASLSSLDESSQPRAPPGRHVRFAAALEREIQFFPPTDDHGATTRDGSADCSSSSCCWYSRDDLARMEQERRQELNVLSASSRGLALYRRRGRDSKAFGRVLYQLLLRFRHETPAKDDQTKKTDNDDSNDNDDDDSFSIDHADFQLLQRYIARNALVTGVERNVVESVASETRALIGNVQQSVLMVQDLLMTMRQQGDDHDRIDECLRCASIRYSAPSQRFARALGEVHSQIVNVPAY
jgi:hypothetical protein